MFPSLVPACAQDVGSWCAKIYTVTGVDWLAQNIEGIARHGARIIVILLIAVVVGLVGRRAIRRITRFGSGDRTPKILQPLKDRTDAVLLGPQGVARRSQRAASIASLLESILSFVIVTVALILILGEVGINVGPLLASAGIAGVALGFGAQNLVKDFLSGIFMLLEDQYGVGDVVDLGPASGTVIDLGLRTTTVRGVDGTVWYVRNGEILRVGNSSQGESVLIIDLPLSYRADAARAGEVAVARAIEVAAQQEHAGDVIKEPEVQGVVSMSSEAVTIRLVVTVRAGTQWAIGRAIRGAIKNGFDAEGIVSPAADLRHWGSGAGGQNP